MGQQGLNGAEIIDETFAGLAKPAAVHPMGRDDLVEGRPGEDLVAEVARFEQEGGFKRMAEDRNRARAADEAKDASVRREEPSDLGARQQRTDGRAADLAKDSSDDK